MFVADRAREQERLLGHVAEVAAVGGRSSVAQVDAVDEDPAGGRVVEAGDELDERRLAGAGGADERDDLPGRDLAGRRRAARSGRCWGRRSGRPRSRIAPASVPGSIGLERVGRARAAWRAARRAAERDAGLDPLVEHGGQLLQRREELVEVEQEGDQHARRQRAVRRSGGRRTRAPAPWRPC